MGVKFIFAGLFLPLVPLILMAPFAIGLVTKCRDHTQPNWVKMCEKGQNVFCMTLRCRGAEVKSCGSPDADAEKVNKDAVCNELDTSECRSRGFGPMLRGSDACQLCTGDMCNIGSDLPGGGDWIPTTTPTTRATPPPTTTSKMTTSTSPDVSTTVTDGTGGGHFGLVNWLLLIAGSLLIGLFSQNAIR